RFYASGPSKRCSQRPYWKMRMLSMIRLEIERRKKDEQILVNYPRHHCRNRRTFQPGPNDRTGSIVSDCLCGGALLLKKHHGIGEILVGICWCHRRTCSHIECACIDRRRCTCWLVDDLPPMEWPKRF